MGTLMNKDRISRIFGTLVFLLHCIPAFAQEDQLDFLKQFVLGEYHVVGKYPESDQAYQGKIKFQMIDNNLEVVRTIGSIQVKGKAAIDSVTADAVKILRVQFNENDIAYETTYLINSDLDNYARLSGFIYFQNKKTSKPGLEALFHVPEN